MKQSMSNQQLVAFKSIYPQEERVDSKTSDLTVLVNWNEKKKEKKTLWEWMFPTDVP